jgi:hypothetical protein
LITLTEKIMKKEVRGFRIHDDNGKHVDNVDGIWD